MNLASKLAWLEKLVRYQFRSQGFIRVHTYNGYGSDTNNKILRWSTTVSNVGKAILLTQSAC